MVTIKALVARTRNVFSTTIVVQIEYVISEETGSQCMYAHVIVS